MKKAKNIMRRLLAAGAALVLLAGSLPQAVYAEEPEEGAVSIVYTGTEEGDGLNTYENGDAEAPEEESSGEAIAEETTERLPDAEETSVGDTEDEVSETEEALPADEVQPEADVRETGAVPLGRGGSVSKKITFGLDSVSRGDIVRFGIREGSPITWRVLLKPEDGIEVPVSGENRVLIISEYVLANTQFRSDNTSNKWAGSLAQQWCKEFYANPEIWPAGGEKAAIATVTRSSDNDDWTEYRYLFSGSPGICTAATLENEQIFFLAGAEADQCFQNDADRIACFPGSTDGASWWLRSPSLGYSPQIVYVSSSGSTGQSQSAGGGPNGARPALNLDSEAVLFACAPDGKPAANGSLGSIPDNTAGIWKLTVKDSGRTGFNVGGSPAKAAPGDKVEIAYSGAKTGDNEYISVIIKSSENELAAYGSVPVVSAGGTAVFTMPAKIKAGSYTMMVFNEQRNDKVSDIAGNIVEVPIVIGIDAGVTINGGADKEVTYGDPDFTLTGKAASPGKGTGSWRWSSSETDVASVDPDTGYITIKHPGDTTIRASYESSTTAGDASITLTVKNRPVRIAAWKNTVFTYDGTAHVATPVLSGVISADDCTAQVAGEKTNAGTGYEASVTGIEGADADCYELCDENKSCTFTIEKACISGKNVQLGPQLTYNGSEQTQAVTVSINGNNVTGRCSITGNRAKDPGTYTLTVTADQDNFTGTVTKEFIIAKKQLEPTVNITGSYTYSGNPIEPAFTVRYADNVQKTLSSDHYQVEYADNIHGGTGRVIIRPKESSPYTFDVTEGTFTIAKADYSGNTTITYTAATVPYDREFEYRINYGALPEFGKTRIDNIDFAVKEIESNSPPGCKWIDA